jgi:DNA replication licensing factor MCM4
LFVQNSPLVIGEISGLQSQSSDNQQIGQYLWGTDINISQIQLKIRKFLFEFRESSDNNTMDYNYYIRKLEEIINSDIYILNIDGNHINSYDRHLYIQLIKYPSEMIPLLDIVASQTLCEICPNRYMDDLNFKVQVRITNLTQKTRIRELGHNDIDKLICITGITIRNSEVIPEMRSALFKCAVCGLIQSSELQRSKVTEPSECKNCSSKYSFDLIHNRSIYSDKQHVKLQETPEHMPEGETPLTIHLCCYDQLVDYVKPGDRCEIVGIFRAQGLRVNPRKRVTKSIYRIFIDVVHFSKTTTKRQDIDEDDFDVFTEYNTNKFVQNEIKIKELSSNPDIYNILLDSFAPSIWENDDVKKGLLLQLFGGVSKDFSDTGRGRFRGDINILLVGDPSTAKSQLLQFTHNLAPRGIYTSGKVNYL